jgi:hypothetical protein
MTKNSFTDADGRQWVVRITNRTVRDIKDKLGIDVRELLNDNMQPLFGLLSDSLELSRVLFVACSDQAKERGVSEDSFLDGFIGDVCEEAVEAFCTAFTAFFPNPQAREGLTSFLGMVKALQTEALNKATEQLQESIKSSDLTSIGASIASQES